jgi:4-methylaminobutanoate oxidase (formaldehyde-forming)
VDSLRLEKGYRNWSVDITPEENPFEAGLGFCVSLNKDNFIGQEVLRESKEQGIQRKLCTLTIDADPWMVFGGEAVHANGSTVSRIRSAGYGYSVGKTISFAYLPLELDSIGTELEIEAFGERVMAKVSRDTLYDPKGKNLRI